MKKINFTKKSLKILIKNQITYPSRFIADIFGMVARCGILLILYWYVFKINNGVINGTTFVFVAWSMFFYFSSLIIRPRNIARDIAKDVQTGNIEILFSKPISYLYYKVLWQVGSTLYSFIIITIISSLILFFIIGAPTTMTSIYFFPTLFLTFILSTALSFLIYIVIGLSSFWIEDINPILWIIDKAIMILGGSYLPIAFFPKVMKQIATYSPIGASQFITRTVSIEWQSNWYKLIGIQLFWIIIFSSLTYFIFKKATKKISINGG